MAKPLDFYRSLCKLRERQIVEVLKSKKFNFFEMIPMLKKIIE